MRLSCSIGRQCFVISINRWHRKMVSLTHTCERFGTGRSCSILHTRPAVKAWSAVSNLTPYWTGKTSCCQGEEHHVVKPLCLPIVFLQLDTHICSWLVSSAHTLKKSFLSTGFFSRLWTSTMKLVWDLSTSTSFCRTHNKVDCSWRWMNKRAQSSNTSHSYQCGRRDFQFIYEALDGSGIWRPIFVKQIQDDLEKNKTRKSWKPLQNLNALFASHLPCLTHIRKQFIFRIISNQNKKNPSE